MKTKNPLRKRLSREFRRDLKKYLALFLLLSLTIGAVAAMYVANDSMEAALKEGYELYNIEDGHFSMKDKPSEELKQAIEDTGDITLYEQFYKDFDEDVDGDGNPEALIRVFKKREKINRLNLMKGRFPEGDNEIVIDRMHADNNGISVGDTIFLGELRMQVVGLVAFSDYSTLYKSNSDTMFDALTFNIGAVTPQFYDRMNATEIYQYAFKYKNAPENDYEKKEASDDLLKKVSELVLTGKYFFEVTNYVPEYINNAIHFAPNDMGSDKAMAEVLLIILVIVLAFVFAITASNTILNESAVIGTLRASGYRRGELIRHYLTMPVLVTLLAAVFGNILGYTVLKNVVVSMYYHSYSLPTYVTRWNADALIRTTVIPVGIVILVNIIVISTKMRFSPLQFLRCDLSSKRKKKAIRLPKIGFMGRFRLRILLRNFGGYLVLFMGIAFVNVLLGFAVGLPATLDNYQGHAVDYMLVDYQYILKSTKDQAGNRITTSEPSAEAYSVCTLETIDNPHIGEKITVFGYMEGSRYFHPDRSLTGNEIFVTDGYAAKFGLKKGDEIALKEEFSEKTYHFQVAGVYEMPGTVGALLPNERFNEIFGYGEESFTGYLSEKEITDIDEDMIAAVVTIDDILKIARQLDHSMGGYMTYFEVVCVLMAIVIIYLLTKILIERNVVSISMVKVLGYTNREINSLYIRITSFVVVFSAFLGAYLSKYALSAVWKNVLNKLNGWFTFYTGAREIVEMALMILIAYAVVVFFDMRRIRRIPMSEALKNVE